MMVKVRVSASKDIKHGQIPFLSFLTCQCHEYCAEILPYRGAFPLIDNEQWPPNFDSTVRGFDTN